MMHGCIYGRLGGDPVERRTRDDNVWATGSLAVNIDQEQDAPPLWIGIVAFGRLADDLLRHRKGDLLSISGKVQLNRWHDRHRGQPREQLEIVADSLISARTVRKAKWRRRSAPDPVAGG